MPKPIPKPIGLVLLVPALLLIVPVETPARPALHCDIPANPAGFVVLQEKPSARARTVARMMPGDEVELLEGSRGKWVEVLHWRGQDRKSATRASDTRRGWVEARFIGACE